MDEITSFGEWLRRRRKALDLTQAELADQAGCVTGTIRSIEADARRPSKQLAERLADVLQLAHDERAPFMQAARAELSPDQLGSPTRVAEPTPPVAVKRPHEQVLQTGLPSGTVTFLMTDIEGSTQLWEQHPQAMRTALARHDTLLQQAVTAVRGVVVKSTGDGLLAVFVYAADALMAALNAQRALQRETWDTVAPLRVRMALHTGVAEQRAGDYFGAPLNRIARLCAAGHGGQVLLSRASWELLADHLPPELELGDLGVHQLKDLSRPEHIYQLLAPDLPAEFPRLRTLDLQPNNLPAQPTMLLGREHDVWTIGDLLRRDDVRLLTLTGPGGTGKTRLAIQLGAELLDRFPDGVWFIDLAPIRDQELVMTTIAHTLGVKEVGGRPLIEELKNFLHSKQLLLVLDNFEQVVDAAPQVAGLLAAASQLKVLVTSRVTLHVRGEKEYAVPPLPIPDPKQPPMLEALSQYAAVELFIQRAQDVKPGFQVTNENAPAVAEICHRLDGLPLAIELAAARIKLFTPEALLRRLEQRLSVLTGGPRDVPPRQRTLRNTIDWSYDLLEKGEQQLFARLAVFIGSCTLDAVEAVCNAERDLPFDLIDGVTALVDKNLLRQGESADGEPRFTMLETIREYGLERLKQSGEEAIRQRHAKYYLALADNTAHNLFGAELAIRLSRLDDDLDNLRAAMGWALEHDSGMALQLVYAMGEYLFRRNYWDEYITVLDRALEHGQSSELRLRARTMVDAGYMMVLRGNVQRAEALLEEGLVLAREIGDAATLVPALIHLGQLYLERNDFDRAAVVLNEARYLAQDNDQLAGVLTLLIRMSVGLGDNDQAARYIAEMLDLAERTSNPLFRVEAIYHQGSIAVLRGDAMTAYACLEQSLAQAEALGKMFVGHLSEMLGRALILQGNLTRAKKLLVESLTMLQEVGASVCIAHSLEALARLVVARAAIDPPQAILLLKGAARLLAAAEEHCERLRMRVLPIEHALYEQTKTDVWAHLDDTTFATAWAEGRAMSLEQAVAEALEANRDALRDDG
jgi:predicted ATPase/class 3 adenylate cyclase